MPDADDCLFMKLPARGEHLAAVRHAVGSVARQFGMTDPGVADLQIVVTEACSNVVVHAYRDMPAGPLEVEARCDSDEVGVVVRDSGMGFQSQVAPDAISLRLGLAMISTLSSGFEVSERDGGGTEVRVRLPLIVS